MLTNKTNLQDLDWQNKNIKNLFTGNKKADTLSDKLEMFFGPIVFALSILVWIVAFVTLNQA